MLPLRLAGCGLRNSSRVSHAAYWASWADSIKDIVERYPVAGNEVLTRLTALQSLDGDQQHTGAACLVTAELVGKQCSELGFTWRPLWADLAAGVRPPETATDEHTLGEWSHGWQFHGSDGAERDELALLKQVLALPSMRRNAASTGKARLESCMGPFASTWLTASPTTDTLCLRNAEFMCEVRRRLGIAVCFDGPDQHGHGTMTSNRGGVLNARHSYLLVGWRQVFFEAVGAVPDRNVERMLRSTYIPADPGDTRRLDLVVPGLNVHRGLPLFCDVTVVTPITAAGGPRGGTSNRGGSLLEHAERDNNDNYHEVISSGLGELLCLGCEVFGRWSSQCVKLVPALARERSRGLHPRIRR